LDGIHVLIFNPYDTKSHKFHRKNILGKLTQSGMKFSKKQYFPRPNSSNKNEILQLKLEIFRLR
jgi:hypothetical protein